MSYDVYIERAACPHCERGPDSTHIIDPTYNLAPIFTLALLGTSEAPEGKPWSLRILDGRRVIDTVDELAKAVERIKDPTMRDQFVALEPENKWGDLPGATRVLERLLEEAREAHSENVWKVT